MNYETKKFSTQTGAALVTTLLILVVVTLASLAAIRSSRLELRMAGNMESKLQSFQTAQAMADAVYATPAMIPVIGAPGYTVCTPTMTTCDRNDISIAQLDHHIASGELVGVVQHTGEGIVPRGLETSADKFGAVRYRINATFDRTDQNLGRADIVQGMLVLVPKQ